MKTRTIVVAGAKTTHHHSGIFAGFGWSDGATIIAAVAAAVIAALIAVIGYSVQRKITRRSERADLYGNAIGAVEAYLEGPYRIRRKINDSSNWFALSSGLSDAKTAMSHHRALLEMHAPDDVTSAYKEFVFAAIGEAGPQMTAAWNANPMTSHRDVPLGTGYDRSVSDAKRADLVAVMAEDLKAISSWWRLDR